MTCRPRLIPVLILALVAGSVQAEVAQVNPRRASGGMSQEFKNQQLPASPDPMPLTQGQVLTDSQRAVSQAAREVFEKNQQALTMLIIDRGQIIYEAYRSPATENTAQFSWSMSKSLTAYTIGHLYCDRRITSLDDRAKTYARELEGTVQGDASIKNLLTMSSGAKQAVTSGNAYSNANGDDWTDARGGKYSGLEILHKFGQRDIASGQEFRYLGNDTRALGLVADNLGGFVEKFQEYVWRPARTANAGYWLLDRDRRPIVQAGFSATTRDWARLAMYTIRLQKSSDSACIRDFMASATKTQLKNSSRRVGRVFEGYGYQTWTGPKFGDRQSHWWLGFGGQRVGIDVEKERIIVVTSWREDYMDQVYRLFEKIQNM